MGQPLPAYAGFFIRKMKPWRYGKESSAARGYGSRWQKARATHLANSPLCVYHQQHGRTVAATVVDHITPHNGDQALFWNSLNWQSLCKICHDSIKAREERGTIGNAIGLDGWPIERLGGIQGQGEGQMSRAST